MNHRSAPIAEWSEAPREYRPDIDGLRAIAVVSIVLFHFGLFSGTTVLPGGFVGVDIFFVISGFLISSIILPDIARGRFSLAVFYERRARRILPALLVVIAATIAAGIIVLLPTDLRDLGRAAVAASLFSANVLYWLRTGYFDASALSKPLLHTWSLGIEEQFYVAFPVMILFAARVWPARLPAFVLTVATTSLAASMFLTGAFPASSFYLLHSRAWELLIGTLVFFVRKPGPGPVAESVVAVGGALILASVLLINEGTPFPGIAAAVPTVGAALLLWGGGASKFASWSLASSPAVFIGKISYSLYLWHWPLLVLARYELLRSLTWLECIGLALILVPISAASWRWIEQPFRRSKAGRLSIFSQAGIAVALVVTVGLVFHFTNGLPQRLPVATSAPDHDDYHDGKCLLGEEQASSEWDPGQCTFGSTQDPRASKIVLWGDSYAAHYISGLEDIAASQKLQLTQITRTGCPPFLDYDEPYRHHCREFNRVAIAWIEKNQPNLIVISARWNRYRDETIIQRQMRGTLAVLSAAGARVLIIAESPVYPAPVPQIIEVLRRRNRPSEFFIPTNDFRTDGEFRAAAALTRTAVFYPREILCIGFLCRLSVGGYPLHRDDGHLTRHGSKFLGQQLLPLLKQQLAPAP